MTTQATKSEKPFELKPYNKKQLCLLYGISLHILNRWLKRINAELGKPIARLYCVNQVKIIVKHFGIPGQVVNETQEVKKAA
jgi:hypothetical protein